jgi:3',5'-cyclic AMP phosphodiesterase CpdA
MRIVHISDLHLRHHLPGTPENLVGHSRAMPQLFERALARIRQLAPDLLVLSGDLLECPFEAFADPDLQALARQDLHLIAGLLAGVDVPIALVHGNHDHPALVAEVYGSYPDDFACGAYRVLAFADDEGPGHVPQRTGAARDRFLAALADTQSPPQIHVQHFVVWPERNEGYPYTYGDGAQLRDQIVASGNVRLVLSGHYHAGVPPLFDKGVTFATVPAFVVPPHPFWVYDLDASGEVHHRSYQLEGNGRDA